MTKQFFFWVRLLAKVEHTGISYTVETRTIIYTGLWPLGYNTHLSSGFLPLGKLAYIRQSSGPHGITNYILYL